MTAAMEKDNPNRRRAAGDAVGIMADSHGSAESIRAALQVMERIPCRKVFHLGDICDSLRPESAAACVAAVQDNGVTAILGNNDRTLLTANRDRNGPTLPLDVANYLNDLPSAITHGNAELVHSLPFQKELGPASLLGSLDEKMAVRWLTENPNRILFRGHSHAPEIRFLGNHGLHTGKISPGMTVRLSIRRMPCVITCGALTRKLCMIWEPQERLLTCHRI